VFHKWGTMLKKKLDPKWGNKKDYELHTIKCKEPRPTTTTTTTTPAVRIPKEKFSRNFFFQKNLAKIFHHYFLIRTILCKLYQYLILSGVSYKRSALR
jgi:hypothetical protein